MQYADNQHSIAIEVVQNAVAAVWKGADRRIDLGPQCACKRVPAKQIECMLEAPEIGLGLRPAELGDAIVEYPRQIGDRLRP